MVLNDFNRALMLLRAPNLKMTDDDVREDFRLDAADKPPTNAEVGYYGPTTDISAPGCNRGDSSAQTIGQIIDEALKEPMGLQTIQPLPPTFNPKAVKAEKPEEGQANGTEKHIADVTNKTDKYAKQLAAMGAKGAALTEIGKMKDEVPPLVLEAHVKNVTEHYRKTGKIDGKVGLAKSGIADDALVEPKPEGSGDDGDVKALATEAIGETESVVAFTADANEIVDLGYDPYAEMDVSDEFYHIPIEGYGHNAIGGHDDDDSSTPSLGGEKPLGDEEIVLPNTPRYDLLTPGHTSDSQGSIERDSIDPQVYYRGMAPVDGRPVETTTEAQWAGYIPTAELVRLQQMAPQGYGNRCQSTGGGGAKLVSKPSALYEMMAGCGLPKEVSKWQQPEKKDTSPVFNKNLDLPELSDSEFEGQEDGDEPETDDEYTPRLTVGTSLPRDVQRHRNLRFDCLRFEPPVSGAPNEPLYYFNSRASPDLEFVCVRNLASPDMDQLLLDGHPRFHGLFYPDGPATQPGKRLRMRGLIVGAKDWIMKVSEGQLVEQYRLHEELVASRRIAFGDDADDARC
ncbi:unnamed protein product, partial [Mesorhabditis spiculigera]